MTKLLVLHHRNADEQKVDQCYGLLSLFPNLDWVAPDLAIADVAARIRAGILLTNDLDLSRVDEIEVVILQNLR